MKEKIYTIPVNEAFRTDCECPACVLEKDLEDRTLEFLLGPSLMEPDSREVTNKLGFCRRHFELAYNRKLNTLGLALILDTHLAEQIKRFKKLGKALPFKGEKGSGGRRGLSLWAPRLFSKKKDSLKLLRPMAKAAEELETSCTACERMKATMDRYIDVILYLYFEESEFRELFHSKKGFCIRYFRLLLEGAAKYLRPKQLETFAEALINMQLKNLERIQGEVNWFTKKMDYRHKDEPWGNSRDAVQRAIEKLAGFCQLK